MSTTATRVIVTGEESSRRSLFRRNRPEHVNRPGLRKRAVRESLAGYGFLVPWLVGFFGLTLIPMAYSLYVSFTAYNIFSPPRRSPSSTCWSAPPSRWRPHSAWRCS